MGTRTLLWLLAGLVALAAAGGYFWSQRNAGIRAPVPLPQQAEAPAAPAASAAEPPAIRHPIAAASAASAPGSSEQQLTARLNDIAGRKGVLSFVQTDGLVNRLVATVDNLDREQAPSKVWPVNPTPGRFAAIDEGKTRSINPDNSLRYAPLVQFVEAIDTAQAVQLYVQMYPQFQQAYEDLGYPGKYFNDRLIAIIDHLLQTPVPDKPVELTLTEIKGPIPSQRPWVHYEFADPALERRSAGQKLLLRMGPVNQRRLMAKLADLRGQLVEASGSASAGDSLQPPIRR
jgi:hypothetical protein